VIHLQLSSSGINISVIQRHVRTIPDVNTSELVLELQLPDDEVL
jgi:hypothetical protein